MDTSTEKDIGSQLVGVSSPQRDLATVVAIAGGFSSLVNYSESSMKRGDPEPMDIEEMDTAPKKQKLELGQQLVHVKRSHAKGQAKKKNSIKE